MFEHTSRGLKQDQKRRSKQNWERGRGARRISNPRYTPKFVTVTRESNGKMISYKMKVYTLRK